MNILRIQTSPRGEASESRRLGDHLIAVAHAARPQLRVTIRDLSLGVPLVDGAWIGANFTDAAQRSEAQHAALAGSEALIAELEAADEVVIELPIWNFSVPSSFKAWIDQVVRARRSFRMLEGGYEGLLRDRRTYVIVTSGGVPLGSGYDFATPYVRHVLDFIGIRDVVFVDATRLMFDAGKPDAAREAITAHIREAAAV